MPSSTAPQTRMEARTFRTDQTFRKKHEPFGDSGHEMHAHPNSSAINPHHRGVAGDDDFPRISDIRLQPEFGYFTVRWSDQNQSLLSRADLRATNLRRLRERLLRGGRAGR